MMNATLFSFVQSIIKTFTKPFNNPTQNNLKNNFQYQSSLLNLKKSISKEINIFHIFQIMHFMENYHGDEKFFSKFLDDFRSIIFHDDEVRLREIFSDENFLRQWICLRVLSEQGHIKYLNEMLYFFYKLGESLVGRKIISQKIVDLTVCLECAEHNVPKPFFYKKKIDIRPYIAQLSRSLSFMLVELFHYIIVGNELVKLKKEVECSYESVTLHISELFSKFSSVGQLPLFYLRRVLSVNKLFFFWKGKVMTYKYFYTYLYTDIPVQDKHIMSFISSEVFFKLLSDEFMMNLDDYSEWLLSISYFQGETYICIGCFKNVTQLSENNNKYIENITAHIIHLKFSTDPYKCKIVSMYCV